MENYLTIKEFADLVGISTQAVYQRLDKDLKDYYEVIDNKKYLKKSVLTLFRDNIQKNSNNTQNPELINFLQAENEGLLNQVNEKDKSLNIALKEKNLLLQQINKLRLELDNLKQEHDNLVLENDSLQKENENLKNRLESSPLIPNDNLENAIDEKNQNIIENTSTDVSIEDKSVQEDTINIVSETLKEREETIMQLQSSLAKALQTTAELESQLSKEKENITEKDSQILNKEKRLDEKEDTIKQLLSQLQKAQEHSQYMSTQLARANESLSEATFKAQELTQNQQILMKQQQDNQVLLASTSQPKGLLERIFGKK